MAERLRRFLSRGLAAAAQCGEATKTTEQQPSGSRQGDDGGIAAPVKLDIAERAPSCISSGREER